MLDINELKTMGLGDKIKLGETISILLEKIEDKNVSFDFSHKAQKISWDKLVQAYEKMNQLWVRSPQNVKVDALWSILRQVL